MLRDGCDLEIYALDLQAVLGTANLKADASKRRTSFEEIVLNAARICDVFNVELRLPKVIQKEDLEAISTLLAVADGTTLSVDCFEAKLIKDKHHEAYVKSISIGAQRVLFHSERLEPKPVVFGTQVDTGPLAIFATGKLEGAPEFLDRYTQAEYGQAVPLRFSVSEIRLQRGISDFSERCLRSAS